MGMSAAERGSQVLRPDPAVIDEIADRLSDAIVERVVEAIRAEGITPQTPAATAWLDAQEVAHRLGVSREWVYEHADELGASRIGTGPRPRLRFPPQILDSRGGKRKSAETASEPTKRRSKANGLMPIHAS
jgi:predicted DNA-binding transcriptional regulator AlpA